MISYIVQAWHISATQYRHKDNGPLSYGQVKITFLATLDLNHTKWQQKCGVSRALSQRNYYSYTLVLKYDGVHA